MHRLLIKFMLSANSYKSGTKNLALRLNTQKQLAWLLIFKAEMIVYLFHTWLTCRIISLVNNLLHNSTKWEIASFTQCFQRRLNYRFVLWMLTWRDQQSATHIDYWLYFHIFTLLKSKQGEKSQHFKTFTDIITKINQWISSQWGLSDGWLSGEVETSTTLIFQDCLMTQVFFTQQKTFDHCVHRENCNGWRL